MGEEYGKWQLLSSPLQPSLGIEPRTRAVLMNPLGSMAPTERSEKIVSRERRGIYLCWHEIYVTDFRERRKWYHHIFVKLRNLVSPNEVHFKKNKFLLRVSYTTEAYNGVDNLGTGRKNEFLKALTLAYDVFSAKIV
jgi:hypothetical protein